MFSFILCLFALIAGYAIYGKFVDKVFGSDSSRVTPAVSKADGIDFIALPSWKVFMIQFLNIAGTGPIFGAIMGAKFGPSSYLWIVLGCIFAGAVHDYFTGMLSLRNGGASLPELIGKYLGKNTRGVMLAFSVLLLLLVGTVFVYSPAEILKTLAGDGSDLSFMLWVGIIFIYYIVATMLPIDKIIGKIYPVFACALLFMAAGLMVALFVKWPALPEIWDGLANRTSAATPIFPCLFITIACGAISGFHATQSPLMARCLKDEKLGRPVFYGSMITEGLVALVWAAVASWFFYGGGAAETGGALSSSAPRVVELVSGNWLGVVGGILAVMGVVAAPITSGDTAFRSARLIIADAMNFGQKPIRNRLAISIPLFAFAGILLWFNFSDKNGFENIWGYFGWANQTLAAITLWAATAYLVSAKKGAYYLLTLLPACFMSAVCLVYLFVVKLPIMQAGLSAPVGISIFVLCLGGFFLSLRILRR